MYYKVLCIVHTLFNHDLNKSGGCIFDPTLGVVVIHKYTLYSRLMVVKGLSKFITDGLHYPIWFLLWGLSVSTNQPYVFAVVEQKFRIDSVLI